MMTETSPLAAVDLAALVGARLCHDVVSPLGAIGNGVELLEMSPDYPGLSEAPEMRLIAEAVQAARQRIRAYRIAFGAGTGEQRIAAPELARLVEALSGQGRLTITLEAEGDFSRAELRLVLLGLMCFETALPWGGRILALRQMPGWRLVAESTRSREDPALWAWLTGDRPPRAPAPSEVQFPLLAGAAAAEGRAVTAELDARGGEITF